MLNLKTIAIVLNVLLIFLFVGYFVRHGLPQSLMLWVSSIFCLVASEVNIFYIFMNKKTR